MRSFACARRFYALDVVRRVQCQIRPDDAEEMAGTGQFACRREGGQEKPCGSIWSSPSGITSTTPMLTPMLLGTHST